MANDERLLEEHSPFHQEFLVLHTLLRSFGIKLEGLKAALEFWQWANRTPLGKGYFTRLIMHIAFMISAALAVQQFTEKGDPIAF